MIMSKQTRERETIKGSWTEAEDNQLRILVDNGNNANWASISDRMGGRTAKQCRERWVQNLRPNLEHGPMRKEEILYITMMVDRIGKKWAEISRRLEAENLGCRSDNAVKNWYNGNMNRNQRAERRRNANATANGTRQSQQQQQQQQQQPGRPTDQPAAVHRPSHIATEYPVQQRELPPPMASPIYRQHPAPAPAPPAPATYEPRDHHHHYVPAAAPAPSYYQDRAPYRSYHHQYSEQQQSPSTQSFLARPSSSSNQGRQLPSIADAIFAQEMRTIQHQRPVTVLPPLPGLTPAHYVPAGPASAASYMERRSSAAYTLVESPRSETAEHNYVPSLVSDVGSPSVREMSTHTPSSPAGVSLVHLSHDDKDEHISRSPPTMLRSWSAQSDQHHIPPPYLEPATHAKRPRSYERRLPDLANLLNADTRHY